MARVKAILRRTAPRRMAEVLKIGDVELDRAAHKVSRGLRQVRLGPTEFRLLVFLARHPGQAFTRGQLLDNVWGDSGEGYEEKTVSVHIRRLREKVELDSSRPEIVLTVPGVGYRLATQRS